MFQHSGGLPQELGDLFCAGLGRGHPPCLASYGDMGTVMVTSARPGHPGKPRGTLGQAVGVCTGPMRGVRGRTKGSMCFRVSLSGGHTGRAAIGHSL